VEVTQLPDWQCGPANTTIRWWIQNSQENFHSNEPKKKSVWGEILPEIRKSK
jgi:hypothetical protein